MQISSSAQLNLTLHKSVDALLARQQYSGAVDGYCQSRILESALTLHLLRSQQQLAERQSFLEDYLNQSISPSPIDRLIPHEPIVIEIAQCVMTRSSLPTKGCLDSLSNCEQGRKMIYFGCLLGEVGAVSFSSLPFDFTVFKLPKQPVQTWARVMLFSLKVLYCQGVSLNHLVTVDDQDFLMSTVLQSDIIENNVLTQIVGLLALSKLLERDQIQPSLKALVRWQRADGGMPLMTGLDHFVTPLAGLAILEALPKVSRPLRPSIRAAVMGMADFLASVQGDDGGWSYMTGTQQTDVDDSGLCGAFLAKVDGQKFKDSLHQFHRYSLRMQNEDGGFPTYIAGNPSTPSMTAAALHGMAEFGQSSLRELPHLQEQIQQSLRYLLNIQRKDGTFECRWSSAETHAMYRVAIALRSVQQLGVGSNLPDALAILRKRMTSYLARTQNPDGGWGHTPNDTSNVSSTAYAILCTGRAERELATAGITFLLAQQESGGTFQSRPELLGPRPLVYDIPILPTIAVIHACSYFMREEWS